MECELTKNMPIGAFIVFTGSFAIFLYLLYDDYKKTKENERSAEETIWIYIFFFMLITCIVISGMCIFNSNSFGILGKANVNKRVKKLKNGFKSMLPSFQGRKRI